MACVTKIFAGAGRRRALASAAGGQRAGGSAARRQLTTATCSRVAGASRRRLPVFAGLRRSQARQATPLLVRGHRGALVSSARFFSPPVEDVPVPGLGDSVSEGTIVEWTKAVGDYVQADEVIAVMETDKVSIDIRSPKSGSVVELMAEENDTLETGAAMFKIDTDAAKPEGAGAAEPAATPAADAAPAAPAAATPAAPAASAAAPAAAPAAAKAAAPAAPAPPTAPSVPSGERTETRKKLSRMRLTIAKRLKDSQNTAAMLTTFNEIDMSNLMAMRKEHKDAFADKHGVKLGFMSAFVKASTSALVTYPDVNSTLEGDEQVYHNYVDISVAVGTPTGLVVPVLRDCQNMGFADVERSIAALGKKARDGHITMEDMTGGTFTISNGGVYGSLFGTPILNPPQSAILGMHSIFQRAVPVNGAIEVRPVMVVALTYDHRVIDGAGAVTFLKHIKEAVEDPSRLLLNL